jgi:hypothetical protein
VLEAAFILLEFPSPSRRIFIGSHSLPPSLVRRIGPSGASLGPGQGWADRLGPAGLGPSRPSPRPPLLYVGSLVFWMFPPSACRSMSSVSLRIGHNSLSCKIQHFSSQVHRVCRLLGSSPWLLGIKFASLHDLYRLQGLVIRCLMNSSRKSCFQH